MKKMIPLLICSLFILTCEDSLEDDVKDLQAQNAQQQALMDSLRTVLDSLNTELDSLNTGIALQESLINTFTSLINTQQLNIDSLNTLLEDHQNIGVSLEDMEIINGIRENYNHYLQPYWFPIEENDRVVFRIIYLDFSGDPRSLYFPYNNQTPFFPDTSFISDTISVLDYFEPISNLSGLLTLNLYGNGLDSLPESIGNLTNLEELNLSYNELTSLPESIGNLSILESLDLRNNQLYCENGTETPPQWLIYFCNAINEGHGGSTGLYDQNCGCAQPPPNCTDGIDNDGDGLTDEDDSDCQEGGCGEIYKGIGN